MATLEYDQEFRKSVWNFGKHFKEFEILFITEKRLDKM